MKLFVEKKIDCNRYSVVVKFKEFGSTILTPENEQSLINDYCPKFKMSDIIFTGKYGLDGKKVVSDESGEDVAISVPNKEIAINDLIEVGYTIHMNEINEEEIKTTLNTEDLICRAKVQLFVDKITEHIDNILKDLSKKLDEDYEKIEEIQVG